MTLRNFPTLTNRWRTAVLGLAALALCACSLPGAKDKAQTAHYALEMGPTSAPSGLAAQALAPLASSGASRAGAPTLIVNPPRAASGFDSPRIIYVREAHKLEYFANSEWIDPPARMLGPLLVSAIDRRRTFGAVVLSAGAAAGDLRLDTEIVRLQQEFLASPSSVRFTLRATLVDDKTRRVLAWREFDASVPAASETPYGGVVAANLAVQGVLAELALFLTEGKK